MKKKLAAQDVADHFKEKQDEQKQFAKMYPEHAKLDKVREQSQWLGGFLEWGNSKGKVKTKDSIMNLLSQYFEIDLKKLEEEKMQMLESIREANKK